jgi:hypothetical protein
MWVHTSCWKGIRREWHMWWWVVHNISLEVVPRSETDDHTEENIFSYLSLYWVFSYWLWKQPTLWVISSPSDLQPKTASSNWGCLALKLLKIFPRVKKVGQGKKKKKRTWMFYNWDKTGRAADQRRIQQWGKMKKSQLFFLRLCGLILGNLCRWTWLSATLFSLLLNMCPYIFLLRNKVFSKVACDI